ncbi:MAG: nucleotidyltransferase domain-containing protein, partial [Nitrososphaeraceae archaeon]
MSSIHNNELKAINECVSQITKGKDIAGVCLYGSRAAGYARTDSDYDVIVVLDNYSHVVKYLYMKRQGIRISALIVDLLSIEKDAKAAFLGEFVIGRLLHVYNPIINPALFERLEKFYKKRVIIEQISDIARSLSMLCTEISFPLEYIMFSKIRSRCTLYPNAVYSFYQTYMGNNAGPNTKIALRGYESAFREITSDDKPLASVTINKNLLRLAGLHYRTSNSGGNVCLRLEKKLHELSSYAIHVYAGRKILHYMVTETRSKIRRQRRCSVIIPRFITSPEEVYWKLPEGKLIFSGTNWLQKYAEYAGFEMFQIAFKQRLGKVNSGVWKYTIVDADKKNQKSVVVKNLAESSYWEKSSFGSWLNSQKKFKSSPLFRLATEYKALRYLRSIGLKTPLVEAMVIGKRLLITQHIEGVTMKILANDLLVGRRESSLDWLGTFGEQIAMIHCKQSTLGDL